MTEPLSATELHDLADELAYVNAESLSLDPVRATRAERLLSNEVPRLLAERDDLIEALLDVVNQSCAIEIDGQYVIDGLGTSAYEDALRLLERLGHAKTVNAGRFRWELVWPERKGK